jgi:hypothetical protein
MMLANTNSTKPTGTSTRCAVKRGILCNFLILSFLSQTLRPVKYIALYENIYVMYRCAYILHTAYFVVT